MKLYRTIDDKGGNVFGIAPNPDVAASVLTTELSIRPGKVRLLRFLDGMADMPDDTICNLPRLLEFGPIGFALFDRGQRRWIDL
ncbi:hypothetical protein [Qipengyuania oceanensis]|uniref:Uncharacterized protein n=1 Tax=Qipengyuania oceanensis TaxID=1463597 RepID=A0A844YBP3_9SPHN|nr:hypothetical protein [Qipengyuania oceanensis]MXO61392.1 hypothetical protein [Qipengyuania oceanensis]